MAEGYSKNYFTPKNILIYLVFAVIAYGAIYYFFLKDKTNTYMAPEQQTSQEKQTDSNSMTVTLGAQNDSNEAGTATLTEANGQTTVVINLENPPSDIEQPAHIHMGACPTPGEVVYPLTNVVNGTSETVLDSTLASLKEQLPLAINVHKSAEEANVYVSCGDLQ